MPWRAKWQVATILPHFFHVTFELLRWYSYLEWLAICGTPLYWSEIPTSYDLAAAAFTWPKLGNKEVLSQNLLIQITWRVGGMPCILCHTFIPRWGSVTVVLPPAWNVRGSGRLFFLFPCMRLVKVRQSYPDLLRSTQPTYSLSLSKRVSSPQWSPCPTSRESTLFYSVLVGLLRLWHSDLALRFR